MANKVIKVGEGVGYNFSSDSASTPDRFNTDFNELKRSLESSQTASSFYGVTNKVDTGTGGVQESILILDKGNNIASADRAKASALTKIQSRSGNSNSDVTAIPFEVYQAQSKIVGNEARKSLAENLKKYGGRIEEINKDTDEVTFSFPLSKSYVQQQRNKHQSITAKFLSSLLSEPLDLSRKEEDKIKEKENEKKQKEEEKKRKEEDKQHKEEAKAHRRHVLTAITLATAILGTIVNITRRMLTAVLSSAERHRSEQIMARTLGLGVSDIRNYRNTEKARGLPEGTFEAFYAQLQKDFGDPRHLNTGALEEIAPYIPEAIVPLVRAGNIDLKSLAEIILTGAKNQIDSNLNWAGQSVSSSEARRSIMSSMERFSPQGARILENWVDSDAYGINNGLLNSFGDYLSNGVIQTGLTPVQSAVAEETAQKINEISSILSSIKDDILLKILYEFRDVFGWISEMLFKVGENFMSDEQKLNYHKTAHNNLVQRQQEIQSGLSGAKSVAEMLYAGTDLSKNTDKRLNTFDAFVSFLTDKKSGYFSEDYRNGKVKLLTKADDLDLNYLLQTNKDFVNNLSLYASLLSAYESINSELEKPLAKQYFAGEKYTEASIVASASDFIPAYKISGLDSNERESLSWITPDAILRDNQMVMEYAKVQGLETEADRSLGVARPLRDFDDLEVLLKNMSAEHRDAGLDNVTYKIYGEPMHEMVANLVAYAMKRGVKIPAVSKSMKYALEKDNQAWFSDDYYRELVEELKGYYSGLNMTEAFDEVMAYMSTHTARGKYLENRFYGSTGSDFDLIEGSAREAQKKEVQQMQGQLLSLYQSGVIEKAEKELASKLVKAGIPLSEVSTATVTMTGDKEQNIKFIFEADTDKAKVYTEQYSQHKSAMGTVTAPSQVRVKLNLANAD